jgi:hypothetical protein
MQQLLAVVAAHAAVAAAVPQHMSFGVCVSISLQCCCCWIAQKLQLQYVNIIDGHGAMALHVLLHVVLSRLGVQHRVHIRDAVRMPDGAAKQACAYIQRIGVSCAWLRMQYL